MAEVAVAAAVPMPSEPLRADSPLNELCHIHQAIRAELAKFAAQLRHLGQPDVEPLYVTRMCAQLSQQVEFLWQIVKHHSHAEEHVFFSALQQRCSPNSIHLESDHTLVELRFSSLIAHLNHLATTGASTPAEARLRLVLEGDRQMALLLSVLGEHLWEEEQQLFPLIQQLFSDTEQRALVGQMIQSTPSQHLKTMIPWMLKHLALDEKLSALVHIMSSVSTEDFRTIVYFLIMGLSTPEWDQLAEKLPQLHTLAAQLEDEGAFSQNPIEQLLDVHRAIRSEVVALSSALDGIDHLPRSEIESLQKRYEFLAEMVLIHSQGEDQIVFPALLKKAPELHGHSCAHDHAWERNYFSALDELFSKLLAAPEQDSAQVREQLKTKGALLKRSLVHHLAREEEQIYPLLSQRLSAPEQRALVGQLIGVMPAHTLREFLPWLYRTMSAEQQTTTSAMLLELTGNTMFAAWLRACSPNLPAVENSASSASVAPLQLEMLFRSAQNGQSTSPAVSAVNQVSAQDRADSDELEKQLRECWDGFLRQTKGDFQASVRRFVASSQFTYSQKTRFLQSMMSKRWSASQRSLNQPAPAPMPVAAAARSIETPIVRTYADESRGVLGCKHYERECRIQAVCCGAFFACHTCHDDQSDHLMDRTQTKRMQCMQCGCVQPVAQSCSQCHALMGRYFCRICCLFDNRQHATYHCPFCNICRRGRGLGEDFFHCMCCNACLRIGLLGRHTCVERSIESNCPICAQFMFTSTASIKILPCGHAMHVACFRQYAQQAYACPMCKKSFTVPRDLFRRIDEMLAQQDMSEFRNQTSQILCNDCHTKAGVPFHFEYHKCPSCGSYNTSVTAVERRPGS